MMQTEIAGEHQDQGRFSPRGFHLSLDISGRRPQGQLNGAMGTGLGAGQAQHAVAVVLQMSGMGTERTTRRGQAFSIRRPTLEAGIAAATAAAGAHLSPQLQDRELGEQTVHSTDRTEISAPETLFELQRANHGSCSDQQQQATA